MDEWFKSHAWKACVGLSPPRVRIPPSPPQSKNPCNSMSYKGFLVSDGSNIGSNEWLAYRSTCTVRAATCTPPASRASRFNACRTTACQRVAIYHASCCTFNQLGNAQQRLRHEVRTRFVARRCPSRQPGRSCAADASDRGAARHARGLVNTMKSLRLCIRTGSIIGRVIDQNTAVTVRRWLQKQKATLRWLFAFQTNDPEIVFGGNGEIRTLDEALHPILP